MQVIITVIPEGALAVENTEESNKEENQEVEIGREYEIKEEETWDVSKNQDGSVMAKWTLEDRTLVISGNGEMRDWYDENIDWHNNQYTDVIKNVIVEDGVTSIGEGAFAGGRGLVKIKILERITSIKGGMFYECRSLTNIEIPEGVTSIGYRAFSRCSSLTNIEIPESVTSIGYGAFEDCNSLTNIIIPKIVMSIEDRAFYGINDITVKGNTEGHRYAEKNKVGYIIDEEGPQITYTPNGVTQPKKEHQIQVNIEDKKSGVREETLKYQWTQNTEEPNKESFIEKIENEKIITKRDIDGIWYLWVYAKDKVGNETIKRSEGYNFLNIGDIDGNKKIDITDIMILKRHIISGSKEDWKITGEKLQKADINQKENIDITDLIILKKEVVKQ